MLDLGHDHDLEPLLGAFSKMVAVRLGLHFPPERWPDLQRALAPAVREMGCHNLRSTLLRFLAQPFTAARQDLLVRHLTVGETYFCRDGAAFAALREHILPAVVRARLREGTGARRIRMWSAGCSSGEEAYSMAIALADSVPDPATWNLGVLGTDINPHALAKARDGFYSEWSFRDTGAQFKERCFHRTADGCYRIDEGYRGLVSFAALNLAEDCYPSVIGNTNAMDVIFCRNVLMYFSPDQARAAVARLAHCLADGGWLLVATVETSLVRLPGLRAHRLPGLIAFRKDDAAAARLSRGRDDKHGHHRNRVASRPSAVPTPQLPAVQDGDFARALEDFAAGRYAEAAAVLERLLGRNPADGDALLLLARVQANRGRLEEALAWSDRALAADRLDPAASFLNASILLELGQTQAAAASFRHTLYLDPHRPLAHFALGNLLYGQGRGEEAVRHYRQARSLLAGLPSDVVLPEADGIPAGRLLDTVDTILSGEARA